MLIFLVLLLAFLIQTDITECSPDPVPQPVPLLDHNDLPESDDNNGLFFIYSHWPTMSPDAAASGDDDEDGDINDIFLKKKYGKSSWEEKTDNFQETAVNYEDDDDDDDDYDDIWGRKSGGSRKRKTAFNYEDDDDDDDYDDIWQRKSGGSRKRNKYRSSKEDSKTKWEDDEEHLDHIKPRLSTPLSDDGDCWESGEGRPSKFVSAQAQGRLILGEGCEMNCDSNQYKPVCGGNGKTYNNKCFLDEAICFYPDDDLEMILPNACPERIEEQLCEYKRCGENAECHALLGACRCNQGFVGNPRLGCTHGGKCLGVQCGANADCDLDTGRCKCFIHYTGDPNDHCERINLCDGVKCVNNAYCHKGKCLCRPGFEGNPTILCIKVSETSTVEIVMELSQAYDQANNPELIKTLNIKFCDDLLTTSWEENCDVQRGLNSPYAKYKNCKGVNHPVAGECHVINISKGKSETIIVRMVVKYDCRDIKEEKHDFIKNQIKNIPGLREPMTGEVIWYPRKAATDSTFAMPLIFQMSSVTVGCAEDGNEETVSKVEDEEECKDLLSPHRCEGIKAAFSCASEPALQYCSKHCGICSEGQNHTREDCFDMYTQSECSQYKDASKCDLTEIELVCERTCSTSNNCELKLHKACQDIGTSSLCFRIAHIWGCFSHHLPVRFKNMCRKSCGLC